MAAVPDSVADVQLPVDEVLPEVLAALARPGAAVLQAPPGAGKTTRVPLALLDAGWRGDGRIVVLEPRRLAARAAARRMATLRGEPVGATVGLVTREDRQVSAATRVEVVTDGVLVRRLQRDPSLDGVAAVVFDEFHERSLAADLALAFTLDVRAALRPDLRLVVMSATLDGARIARLLDDAPVVTSEGRRFPVETHYRPRPVGERVEPATVAAVEDALAATPGDVLVFLPGAREIRRVAADLADRLPPSVLVAPLFGALSGQEQDRAIEPPPPGTRKVVVATDIAETSITIDGVRAVVDSGLAREPRFDPRRGMTGLETVRISRASADQRRGRAGRTAPGVCYRLWAEREHAGLDPQRRPAIAQEDLAGFVLEIAAWGAPGPEALALLDAPPAATLDAAVDLLRDLGALDDAGRITAEGRAMADLPVHPRLAHLLRRGRDLGIGRLACEVAALLDERDILATDRETSVADAALRVRILRGEAGVPRGASLRRGALARARREAARLQAALDLRGGDTSGVDADRAAELVALAYPDRVARRRGGRGRFVLANGRGATLPEGDVLAGEDLLACADVDLGRGEARIFLAAPITEASLRALLGGRIVTDEVVAFDERAGEVVAERRERLGAVVLRREPIAVPPDEATTAALLDAIRSRGLDRLPWTRDLSRFRDRVSFLHRVLGEPWPDMSDAALLADLEEWLAPYLAGIHRLADLGRVPLHDALAERVGWSRVRDVDRLAPTHIEVPSGARVPLDYAAEDGPVLPVRVQQAFGWAETPHVADGRVPVTIHLLSPAHRPVQVTRDLAGFWERGYPQVRAELRGRYPKHPWPEDPSRAPPTDRAKPR